MAGEARTGDWKKLKNIMGEFDERLHRNAEKTLRRAGEELASDMKTRILDGKDMKPLHGFTIAQKGSSKPLVDDGDMLGSIGVRFIEELAVFVGAHRKTEDGRDLVELHNRENGTRVKVTPKMRAYLRARGFNLKKETTELFIPGRPFIKPAYEDFKDRKVAEKLALQMVEDTLEGKG